MPGEDPALCRLISVESVLKRKTTIIGVDEEVEDREDESSGKGWVKPEWRPQACVIRFSYLTLGLDIPLLTYLIRGSIFGQRKINKSKER